MSASKTRAAFALSGAWLLAVRSALLRRKCVPVCLSWLLAAGASSPGAAELLTAQFCASAMTSVQAATSDRLRSDEASRETLRGDLHVMMGHLTDGTTYTTYELLNIERLTESRSIPLRAARSLQLSAVTLHGWEEFETGSPQPVRVTVEGYWQRDGTFLVSELVEQVAEPSSGLVGRSVAAQEMVGPSWNVLVILADISGQPPMTFPDNEMLESDLLDPSPGAVSGYTYYMEASYGQLELQGTVTEVVIEPPSGCDQPELTAAMIDAIEAVYLADPTVVFSDFDTIYLIAPFDCPFGNIASTQPIDYPTPTGPVAVGVVWTDAVEYNKGSLIHEIGHTMSLQHSHSIDCTPDSLAIDWRRLCALSSYGDKFGVMGGSSYMGHFPPIQKERLGWLSVPEVTQPGSHVLEPLSTQDGGQKAIKIPSGDNSHLYVSFRQPIGYDTFDKLLDFHYGPYAHQGVTIHFGNPDVNRSILIDTTVPNFNFDVTLRPGETFTDPFTGTTIELTSMVLMESATVYVDPRTMTDADGDGFPPPADCDDDDPTLYPGVGEDCADGIDNDCDGLTDASDPDCAGPCVDADGDGATVYCWPFDCDDSNSALHPEAVEVCDDGVDNDCDTRIDDADDDCQECVDHDNDLFAANCPPFDCDDSNPGANPNAIEVCSNGLDNDCDGLTGAADSDCASECTDSDSDGFGLDCPPLDCSDDDPAVNPAATEVCSDGIDNDCDGYVDTADSNCAPGCFVDDPAVIEQAIVDAQTINLITPTCSLGSNGSDPTTFVCVLDSISQCSADGSEAWHIDYHQQLVASLVSDSLSDSPIDNFGWMTCGTTTVAIGATSCSAETPYFSHGYITCTGPLHDGEDCGGGTANEPPPPPTGLRRTDVWSFP